MCIESRRHQVRYVLSLRPWGNASQWCSYGGVFEGEFVNVEPVVVESRSIMVVPSNRLRARARARARHPPHTLVTAPKTKRLVGGTKHPTCSVFDILLGERRWISNVEQGISNDEAEAVWVKL